MLRGFGLGCHESRGTSRSFSQELSHSLADALARTRQAAGESWEEWRPVVEAWSVVAKHWARKRGT